MMKYIPLVLFIFSWPVLSADIHGRVVRVLDGDTIEVTLKNIYHGLWPDVAWA